MAGCRAIVVGGGVIGCSLAYHLAGAGCKVTLLERATIAAEATGAAAGMLAPLAESATPGPFLDLAVAGLRAFQEDAAAIEATSGLRVEYVPSGIVRPAADRARAAVLQRGIAWAADAGLPVSWLDADALRRLEPALAESLAGGLYSPEEGHVRPRRLAAALAHGAARRGAEIREGAEVRSLCSSGAAVTGVELADGARLDSDVVLLAGGAWTRFCADGVLALPACPVRGQYLLLRSQPQPVRRVVYGEGVYMVPRVNGTLYVGATEEHDAGFHKQVTAAGLRRLLDAAIALVPALGTAELVATGVGLRPGSPDQLPLLGWAPSVEGLAVATGHFRNGVLLSLITGRLLTELIVYGRTSLDLAPFSPGRFADETAAPVPGNAASLRVR